MVLYSHLSRSATARGSCTGLVQVLYRSCDRRAHFGISLISLFYSLMIPSLIKERTHVDEVNTLLFFYYIS